MRVEVVTLPIAVGIGSPPSRWAETVRLYPTGEAVIVGEKRVLVFDKKAQLLGALRYLDSKKLVPAREFESWTKVRRDVAEIPCKWCRGIHLEKYPSACGKR